MSKNKNFKNVYLVTFEGKTTNGFIARLLDQLLRAIVRGVGVDFKQVKATIVVAESQGDYNATDQTLAGGTE